MGDRNHSGPDNACQDIVISAHATLLSVRIFSLLGILVKKKGKAEASQGTEERWLLLPRCARLTSLSCIL